jgi:hypothetical protein
MVSSGIGCSLGGRSHGEQGEEARDDDVGAGKGRGMSGKVKEKGEEIDQGEEHLIAADIGKDAQGTGILEDEERAGGARLEDEGEDLA